jgi:hypothetical protein
MLGGRRGREAHSGIFSVKSEETYLRTGQQQVNLFF